MGKICIHERHNGPGEPVDFCGSVPHIDSDSCVTSFVIITDLQTVMGSDNLEILL